MVEADIEENPRGTQVSLLRLEFHFFFFAFFWVPSILLRADQTQRSSSSSRPIGAPTFFLTLHLFVRSFLCSSAFFVSSSHLFVLPRCWRPDHPPSRWRSNRPPTFFSNQITHPALDRLLQCYRSPTKLSSSALRSSSSFVFLQVRQKSSFKNSILLFRTQVL